jgi:MtrB/PioB family decaheme-associated outer membrane protein
MSTVKPLAIAAAFLLLGTLRATAQTPPADPAGQTEPATAAETASDPAADADSEFTFDVDSLTLSYEEVDNDTNSAKFNEYRDFSDGFLGYLSLTGGGGDRHLRFDAWRAGADDGRYTLDYGVFGSYGLELDYNLIVHNFGNDGRLLWSRDGSRYFLPDSMQADLQARAAANQSRLNFAVLDGFIQPYLANARSIDVGLTRDRFLANFDFGRMAAFDWSASYFREERDGTRPFGGSFGFNNVTELPEPVEYTTQNAEVAGEWNGPSAGVRFGYRLSTFDNDVDTLYFDNPWRLTDSTDPNAYNAPSTSSVGGASLGMADLAPDNEADTFFLTGRANLGTWFVNGNAAMISMEQDDELLPYTLNTAIVGVGFDGAAFDPTNPANLPARNADAKVDVMTLNAQGGTDIGKNFDLTFRYRFYDYDSGSRRLELPGYVRFHGVWEDIPRVSVPYSYTKQDLSGELGWDLAKRTRLALIYGVQTWDREFREVESSDEDRLRLTFDTQPWKSLSVRAHYEMGDRSIDHYDTHQMEATFIEQGDPTVPADLRRYDEAAREYDDFGLQVQWFVAEAWNLTVGVTGRDENYEDFEQQLGLIDDEVLRYSAEVGYAPGEHLNVYAFADQSDRQVFVRSRQSGSTPSTRPLDNWLVDFDEDFMTLGIGANSRFAKRFTAELIYRQTESDGFADFTAYPGGLPLGNPPRVYLDIPNYEDIELSTVFAKLGYDIGERFRVGMSYLWEEYTIDSFITQGLAYYLPGALLINGNNGDYDAQVIAVDFGIKF